MRKIQHIFFFTFALILKCQYNIYCDSNSAHMIGFDSLKILQQILNISAIQGWTCFRDVAVLTITNVTWKAYDQFLSNSQIKNKYFYAPGMEFGGI